MGADGGQGLFGQFAFQQAGAFQAMFFRCGFRGGIVHIVQQAGQAPQLFIFTKFTGQGPHDGLGSDRMLQQACLDMVFRQQGQRFVS